MKTVGNINFVAPTPTQIKILGMMAGIILLGELFLILGALQILPAGVNAVSLLGRGGIVGIALTLPIPFLALALCMMARKKIKIENRADALIISGSVGSLQEHSLVLPSSTELHKREESGGVLAGHALVRALGVNHTELQAALPFGEMVFDFSVQQTPASGGRRIQLATIYLVKMPGLELKVVLTVHNYSDPSSTHPSIQDGENRGRQLEAAHSVSTNTLHTLLEIANQYTVMDSFSSVRPCLRVINGLEGVFPDFLSQLFRVPHLSAVHFDIMTRQNWGVYRSVSQLALCERFSPEGRSLESEILVRSYTHAPTHWGGWGCAEKRGPDGKPISGVRMTIDDSAMQERFKALKACARGDTLPQQLTSYPEGISATAHVTFGKAGSPLALPSSYTPSSLT